MTENKCVKTYTPAGVLVTGGAGFIASHVANNLVQKYPDVRVVVIDKLSYCSSLQNLANVLDKPNFKFVSGNILSLDLLKYVVETERIDTILHFAAQTHVDVSFGDSIRVAEDNINGTHALLEVSKATKIRRFIFVSTDEVYGDISHFTGRANEEDGALLSPTNPYAASKAAAEMLVVAYGRSFGLKYIITRGNNVYGPHQYPEKLVPKFYSLAQLHRNLPVHGDGEVTRSYLHVSDVVRAFDIILHFGKDGEVYNIATDDERSVLSVAHDICAHTGQSSEDLIEHVADRAYNDRRYFIDHAKLKALGWKQEVSWPVGLKETLDWYASIDMTKYWGDVTSALAAHPIRKC